MTPQDAIVELLARVGAGGGEPAFLSASELRDWPAAAVCAMKTHKLLVKARPAASVVCPGCEQACVMPVHVPPANGATSRAFVICDKRDDINRVAVTPDQLTRWRSDAPAIGNFVAMGLELRRNAQVREESGVLIIGMASGAKRHQMLYLRSGGDLELVAGEHAVPLAELVDYHDGAYAVDGKAIRRLVDSATAGDPRYTPSNARREARKLDTQEMYRRWQRAYLDLRKRRPGMFDVWYAKCLKRDLASERSADTIRKHMKG